MTSRRSLALLLVVCSVSLGCRTVEMTPVADLVVPAGLSTQQVEVAILSGVANRQPGFLLTAAKPIPSSEYDKLLDQNYIMNAGGNAWFPESRKPGEVLAAVKVRGHYLEVSLKYDQSRISTEIVKTQNLQQENGRIHRKVYGWIENLHAHINRELGRMTYANQGIAAPPETP